MTEIKHINATFDDNKYYRLSPDGYVDTNADEEDIKSLDKRFNTTFPRKSIRIPPKKKEVWLLWDDLFGGEISLYDIYSTKDIAQKNCDECNEKEIKRCNSLGFSKPHHVYSIESWPVSTE